MADGTKIEWSDATWNIITGCSVVSPGCTNCYAMRLAGTRLRNDPSRKGLTIDTKAGPVWNGEVRLNDKWLDQPLHWKRPRKIFVCAHGDLFHGAVPDEWLDKVFAVMALCAQHIFQVLTKRPERMREYLQRAGADTAILRTIRARIGEIASGNIAPRSLLDKAVAKDGFPTYAWPLPNLWLGVSAEDQERANERVPILLNTPAAVRWVSAEPLLGPIEFLEADMRAFGTVKVRIPKRPANVRPLISDNTTIGNAIAASGGSMEPETRGIDWIVVGGESGPGARPMHPDWARDIRDQCKAADVAFHFKQWGAWFPCIEDDAGDGRGMCCYPDDGSDDGRFDDFPRRPVHRFPAPAYQAMWRVGKEAAGRLLDGVAHNGFPEIRA